MRKLLLGLGVLLVVAVAYVAINLDAYLNENRAWLEQQVELLLERPVEIGHVGLELGLGVAVRLEDFVIGEHPAFGPEPVLRARAVEVGLRAWPVLFGRYEISHVDLVSPVVRVVRTEEGLNLATLGGAGTPAEQETRREAARVVEGERGAELGVEVAARIVIGLVNIEDGTLQFADRTQDPPLELVVGRIHAEVADPQLGQLVLVELRAELLETAGLPSELSLDGPISVNVRATGTIEAPTMTVALDGSGAAVAYADSFAKPAGTPLELSMRVQFEGDAAVVEDGELRLASALVRFAGTVRTLDSFAYDLRVKSLGLAMSGWDAILPALGDVALTGTADVDVGVAGSADQAGLPPLNGSLTLRDFGARMEGLPELAKLSAVVAFEGNRVVLPNCRLELGGSPFDLGLRVDDFAAPLIAFDARSEAMRIESQVLNGPVAKRAGVLRGFVLTGTAALPAAGPVVDASLLSSEGRLRNIDYRDLRAELHYRNGVATLENGSLHALDGDVLVSGHYDIHDPATPTFDLETSARGVRLEQYLVARFPTDSPVIEGRLSGDLSLAGRGGEWDVIKQFLTGDGAVELEEGVLHGVNLAGAVLSGVGTVPLVGRLVSSPLEAAYPVALGEPNTKFERLAGRLEIRDGRIYTPDLKFRAKDYSIRADGGFSLDADVAMTAVFVAGTSLTQDLVRQLNPLRRLTGRDGQLEIPFSLEGPATKLKVRPDVDQVARSLTTGILTDTLGQLTGGKLGSKKEGTAEEP